MLFIKSLIFFLSFIQDDLVKVDLYTSHEKVKEGGKYYAAIHFKIENEYHIYSKNVQENVLNTVVKPIPDNNLEYSEPLYPKAKLHQTSLGDYEMYEHELVVIVPFELKNDAKAGERIKVEFEYQFQACTDEVCLNPRTGMIIGQYLDVSGQEIANIDFSRFEEHIQSLRGKPEDGREKIPQPIHDKENTIETEGDKRLISDIGSADQKGLIVNYIAGILTSFTPCVLPLFPITISFFSFQAGKSLAKQIILALVYVLGLSLTFAIFGVLAGLAGESFSAILARPYVLLPMAGIIILLGLSLLGLFELKLPGFIMDRLGTGRSGYIGAFIMGCLFSVLAAPCVGPVILSILTDIATKANVYYGGISLFVFALGIGTILLVVALLGSSAPRSGVWTYYIKMILGVVIILYVLIYMLRGMLDYQWLALSVGLLAVVSSLLAYKQLNKDADRKLLSNVTMAVLMFIGGFFVIGAFVPEESPASSQVIKAFVEGKSNLKWYHSEKEALDVARKEGKPVLVDFWATWCVPCQIIRKEILNNPAIETKLNRFILLEMDVTDRSSENWSRMQTYYGVNGVPAIVFYDSSGKLVEKPRFLVYNFTLDDFDTALDMVK